MDLKNRNALDILKGYGAILPITAAAIYFIGPVVDQGEGLLTFTLFVTFLSGISGYIIGTTCTGRWLTIAGIAGICLFAAMVGLLAYSVSQPIVIPPYPR